MISIGENGELGTPYLEPETLDFSALGLALLHLIPDKNISNVFKQNLNWALQI